MNKICLGIYIIIKVNCITEPYLQLTYFLDFCITSTMEASRYLMNTFGTLIIDYVFHDLNNSSTITREVLRVHSLLMRIICPPNVLN